MGARLCCCCAGLEADWTDHAAACRRPLNDKKCVVTLQTSQPKVGCALAAQLLRAPA